MHLSIFEEIQFKNSFVRVTAVISFLLFSLLRTCFASGFWSCQLRAYI